MPFDPSLPANNSPVSSAELRNQFNGLQEEIDDRPDFGNLGTIITDQIAANVSALTNFVAEHLQSAAFQSKTPFLKDPTQHAMFLSCYQLGFCKCN